MCPGTPKRGYYLCLGSQTSGTWMEAAVGPGSLQAIEMQLIDQITYNRSLLLGINPENMPVPMCSTHVWGTVETPRLNGCLSARNYTRVAIIYNCAFYVGWESLTLH